MRNLLDRLTKRCLQAAPMIVAAFVLVGGAPGSLADVNLDACRSAAKASGATSRLVCEVPFVPTEEERQVIVQDSTAMVQDLRCILSIDVSRDDLVGAAATGAWQAPAQSATCDVVTSEGSHVARFSLAPEISLIGGKAIGVKLNADAFEGTPPLIAKALRSYINFNAAFQDRLMDVMNQNLASWLNRKRRAET
ncbi:MAG: hypothetical protein R3F54_18220 [Alphaproteobacteria bacterium]